MSERVLMLALREHYCNSLAQIDRVSVLQSNCGMDIDEIRRRNIRRLEQQHGAPSLASKSGMSLAQFYNLRDGAKDSRTGKRRGMRKETAWRIEDAAGVPRGFLDTPCDDQHDAPGAAAVSVAKKTDVVEIPLMNASGSMGLGRPAPDHETVVDVLRLSRDWVHSNLKSISNPANLAALSAYGDSMEPTFADGDILMVDRGVNAIRLDAVYVLQLHGELFIKRVQRRITDGAIIIKSDNPIYEPAVISNGERESLSVLGRVVWAWNGRKL